MQWLIGIDGGGTKTVGYAANLSGQILGQVEKGPGNYHVTGLAQFKAVITAIVDELAANCGLKKSDLRVISFGLAGADRPSDKEILHKALFELALNCHYIINSDAKVALVAGLGRAEGIVLIAGTGSVAYGINGQGQVIRAGGWGHLASDEGSGYDIGRQALVRGIKATEERDQRTILLPMILEHFGLANWNEFIGFINAKILTKATVASLAPVVATAAQSGDAVATEILGQAAADLAGLVQSVLKRGFKTDLSVQVCLYGSIVNKIPMVYRRLAEVLADQAVVVPFQREPVAGAVQIGSEWVRKSD